MNYISEHRTALIGTIVTHALVLLILLFFGFFTKLPLPEEEGILVNFGDSETGLGLEEPAPGESAPVKNQEENRIEIKTPPPAPAKKVVAPIEKEALMTQDLEKTVVMESAREKKKIKDLEKEKLLKEKREQQEIERQNQAEIARQKKEEDQRLALAAAEQRKAGEINSRAKNAFGGNGKGAADSKSTSQGVTFGTGNQGSTNGSANADKYGPGGGVGNGPSFSLDGRSGLSLPEPNYPSNEDDFVVVQVTVDKNGKVTRAEPGVKGSTTLNSELLSAAKKAALQAKFNVDKNAPAFQVGTITYHFRVK
jgi:colicin import membrane protein